jgi:hypothetical protein
MNLIKLYIASIRWGSLTPSNAELVKKSTVKQVLRASYIQKSVFSPTNIVVLEN